MAAHQKELDNLLHYLKNLPPSVPAAAKIYSFSDYVPDDERVADYGSEQGDLNAYLEVTFGSRHQGHIQFKEKGPNLEAVVPLLKKYINGESKEEVLLLKWVEDLTKSAIALCEAENWNVKRISKPTQKRAAGEEEKEESRKKKQARVDTKTAQDAALKRTA
ncbi:hypothetical protein FRC03_012905 [Tulasnella sp. 419]|nr:hypothetical protein FRC03_012905 [Tulasnella sp. 419]